MFVRYPSALRKYRHMDRAEFIASLQSTKPEHFVEDHLFDRVPHAFGSDKALFSSWKRALSEKIDVDAACIALVGSAATGFSLNPNKNFKPFDSASDIDVAVISNHHFMIGWRYLRTNGSRRLRLETATRNAWDEHVRKYVYWGTIATDRLLGVMPFGRSWLAAISHMSGICPTVGREINLRIYSDYDALRGYQVAGAKSLRNDLAR
jgi:predicted nucleotidyltransferase